MNQAESMVPVEAGERINEIDIVRGIALLGILMVNMAFFKHPVFEARLPHHFAGNIEQFSAWFIQLFFTGNFYAIFSFLFGLGFYIFMERTLKKGYVLLPLYRRRLLVLMAFGLLHLFLLWSGDILLTYALVGFILLAFRNASLESIKKWIIGLFAASIFLNLFFALLQGMGKIFAPDKFQLMMDELTNTAFLVYTEGTFIELISFRIANEVPYVLFSLLLWIPQVLAFFLCGLYAGKLKIFSNISAHISLFKRLRTWGLIIGGSLLLFYFLIGTSVIPLHNLLGTTLLYGINYTASIFIFPAYASSIVLGAQTGLGQKLLSPLAAAGKMALTNYLSQTAICMMLFYGIGFGLYGTVTLSQGIMITLAIYVVQIIWSNIWFKRFRYGPLEWFWRLLTYKKKQPFLILDK